MFSATKVCLFWITPQTTTTIAIKQCGLGSYLRRLEAQTAWESSPKMGVTPNIWQPSIPVQ